jgi:hypothetical protein
MKPPGKTTFTRMQIAAMDEAGRIETSEDARVFAGMIEAPRPERERLRDDFAGIVRLIDAIESDTRLKDMVIERMSRMQQARARPAPAETDTEIEVDAE